MKTNKFLTFLLPLLCFQLAYTDGLDDEDNMYTNENFKKQLDGGFKKYFNDNIYKIKESSRERRFFYKRENTTPNETDGVVQDLSCEGQYISQLKSCSSIDCLKSLSVEQFNAYVKCNTNTETPNYGELINAIVLNKLSDTNFLTANDFKTLNEVNSDVYNKIKFVAEKNSKPYTTDAFLDEMRKEEEDELNEMDNENNENAKSSSNLKLISSNYLDCLNFVEENDEEVYRYDTISVCLCSYGYDGEIKGYDKDIKLKALYSYYGFSEENFQSTCKRVLASSDAFNKENELISKLKQESLPTLLKAYHIPNFGTIFNSMAIKSLVAGGETGNLKKTIYELYKLIGNISVKNYSSNEVATEFGRCVVQARNKIVDNTGLSYCLCTAGYSAFPGLNGLFSDYQISQGEFDSLCESVFEERKNIGYCNLGKNVQTCISKSEFGDGGKNHTACLDIGVKKSYLRQTKCLCDLYNAKWRDDGFLPCYGYTELSFMLGCRQFYPNQMYSDNPARGMENYYSENYDSECGDSGTGNGNYFRDRCVCKVRVERQEVSLELDDICSRIGTDAKKCSAGILSVKYSSMLMLLTIVISLFMFI